MNIRATYQPKIDEFMSNLELFATGNYLTESEKELWDQPFDPKSLPELRKILEQFLDTFDALSTSPTSDEVTTAINQFSQQLEAFNRKNDDAIIEPEETQELNDLIAQVAAAVGADEQTLEQLPQLD